MLWKNILYLLHANKYIKIRKFTCITFHSHHIRSPWAFFHPFKPSTKMYIHKCKDLPILLPSWTKSRQYKRENSWLWMMSCQVRGAWLDTENLRRTWSFPIPTLTTSSRVQFWPIYFIVMKDQGDHLPLKRQPLFTVPQSIRIYGRDDESYYLDVRMCMSNRWPASENTERSVLSGCLLGYMWNITGAADRVKQLSCPAKESTFGWLQGPASHGDAGHNIEIPHCSASQLLLPMNLH